MWCAERTIDSLTGANALLENKLACLEADVQTGHDLYDQFRSDFLCSLRDGETTLSHRDAEISSLKQDNAQLVEANQDKDEEIKLLKAQLAMQLKQPQEACTAGGEAPRTCQVSRVSRPSATRPSPPTRPPLRSPPPLRGRLSLRPPVRTSSRSPRRPTWTPPPMTRRRRST
ncbi:unnamed protein product [Ectocarpus sp. 4 AP-2014]